MGGRSVLSISILGRRHTHRTGNVNNQREQSHHHRDQRHSSSLKRKDRQWACLVNRTPSRTVEMRQTTTGRIRGVKLLGKDRNPSNTQGRTGVEPAEPSLDNPTPTDVTPRSRPVQRIASGSNSRQSDARPQTGVNHGRVWEQVKGYSDASEDGGPGELADLDRGGCVS